jgi:hypothetical protein
MLSFLSKGRFFKLKKPPFDKMSNTDFEEELDLDDKKNVLNLGLPLETRLKIIETMKKEDLDEVLNKLGSMYQFSGINSLKDYLYKICFTTIPPIFKKTVAYFFYAFDNKDEMTFEVFKNVYSCFDSSIGTPIKIDFIKVLLTNEKYLDFCLTCIKDILKDQKLDCSYRYKIILDLKNDFKQVAIECFYFFINLCTDLRYKILSCQFILVNDTSITTTNDKKQVESVLISIFSDEKVDYNTRADSADVILSYGSDESKKIAREVLNKLGTPDRGKVKIIFNNKQNVHTKEIEESVMKIIEFLQTVKVVLTYEECEEELLKQSSMPSVKDALNRINLDNALYGSLNCSLKSILLSLWTYIKQNQHEEELTKRLLQELSEMNGTCSSGFVSRLVNTLSGFCDFSIRISWKDQIISNLSGRLNKLIRDIKDEDLRNKILEEMTSEADNYEKRKEFLIFFIKNISNLREELYNEFKEHITDTDFDLYFRSAISVYETGTDC